MNETKIWWQSRTLWVNIVAALFGLASAVGILPRDVDQDAVVGAIMGVVALANVALRLVTRQPIVSGS